MNLVRAWSVGFLLIVLGAVMVLIGSYSSSSSVGGVILIGPLPIAFGEGPESGSIVLVSLIAAILMLLAIYLSVIVRRRAREIA